MLKEDVINFNQSSLIPYLTQHVTFLCIFIVYCYYLIYFIFQILDLKHEVKSNFEKSCQIRKNASYVDKENR
jgi:hypothetical protein